MLRYHRCTDPSGVRHPEGGRAQPPPRGLLRPRTLLVAAIVIWASAVAAQPKIAPRVAGLYVGQERVVEGKVLSTQREGNTVWLRFGTGPHDFVVTLSLGLLSDFPAQPEEAYRDKTVRVAGTIRSFRGVPEIVLRDASSITIVTPGAPSAAAAVAPEPARATAADSLPAAPRTSELEALRAQIEVLTRRVESLERDRANGSATGK